MARRTPEQMADVAEARVRREKARLELESLKLRREATGVRRKLLSVHRAAERNRFTNDWTAPSTSADSAILPDLIRINARARQLVRDDSYAKSIVRSFRRNVIGTGITPSIDGKSYEKAWRKWARSKRAVDREQRRTFIQVQRWAMDELVTVGEGFVVRWIMGGGSPRLVLQCFESEQLDRYKLQERTTGNEVRGGIEVDTHGAPVAYHFYRRHPHEIRGMARPSPLMLESMRIPADMVCHIYDPERVRQSRGLSRLACVMRRIRDLSEYDATQLRVARAEASIGMMIKGTAMDEAGDPENPIELDGLSVAYLTDEEEMKPFIPSRPGREYEPFIRTQLRAIAAGVGISYEQIARDLGKTTYSGGRQGSIDDHREYEPLQQLIASDLCDPVFDDFVFVWSLQNPEQSADFFLRDQEDLEPTSWQGQGWEWVDPESQGAAVERKMRLGLTSRTREANSLGTSVTELDRERSEDGTLEIVRSLGKADGREAPAPDSPTTTEIHELEVAGAN